ncbi:MAG: hypothetical protein WC415_05280 [Patescibacteria group bacterium]|jgi:hypothetical protein
MDCVCYKNFKNECFVKTFLFKNYSKINAHDIKILADINSRVEWVIENNGTEREGLFEYLPPYKFAELKIRDKNNWIRILCFFDKEKNRFVLLSAYYKPYRYKDGEVKKINKMIEEENLKADLYQSDYLNNKEKRYEKY